ncbi:hypothetical protein BAN_0900007 [Borrelia anserina BA2]|uniref:Uncharacterized protein n=1 Tax=Borrelia anserina BA2 TaxID=1313293 RepID=W5SND0_BORAN|nr:hypothetical protein BAN_0900007 [Borrelia anserina BA2]
MFSNLSFAVSGSFSFREFTVDENHDKSSKRDAQEINHEYLFDEFKHKNLPPFSLQSLKLNNNINIA